MAAVESFRWLPVVAAVTRKTSAVSLQGRVYFFSFSYTSLCTAIAGLCCVNNKVRRREEEEGYE